MKGERHFFIGRYAEQPPLSQGLSKADMRQIASMDVIGMNAQAAKQIRETREKNEAELSDVSAIIAVRGVESSLSIRN